MDDNKHYIKVFYTDDEGSACNLDGDITLVNKGKEELINSIGQDISAEMEADMAKLECGIYGYRIDYKLTRITKDPFA